MKTNQYRASLVELGLIVREDSEEAAKEKLGRALTFMFKYFVEKDPSGMSLMQRLEFAGFTVTVEEVAGDA